MDPETENAEHKEIYTFFGVAAAQAVGFELALLNVLLANAKLSGKAATGAELDAMELDLQKKKTTLGVLLGHVRGVVTISDELDKHMREALRRRNYLIHRFFQEKSFEFATPEGRKRVLAQLKEYAAYMHVAAKFTKDLFMQIATHFGITTEAVEEERNRMIQEAVKAEREDGKDA